MSEERNRDVVKRAQAIFFICMLFTVETMFDMNCGDSFWETGDPDVIHSVAAESAAESVAMNGAAGMSQNERQAAELHMLVTNQWH